MAKSVEKWECKCKARLPTVYGPLEMYYYQETTGERPGPAASRGQELFHLALVAAHSRLQSQSLEQVLPGETQQDRRVRGASLAERQESSKSEPVKDSFLCRIHSSCLTSETFTSTRCDCAEQLHSALQRIASDPSVNGILLYLNQEGRGIGLLDKLK